MDEISFPNAKLEFMEQIWNKDRKEIKTEWKESGRECILSMSRSVRSCEVCYDYLPEWGPVIQEPIYAQRLHFLHHIPFQRSMFLSCPLAVVERVCLL